MQILPIAGPVAGADVFPRQIGSPGSTPLRVCLISPPTVTDFEDPEVAETEAIRLIAEHAPIGILSLAAVIEQAGIVARIIDMNRLYYEFLRSPGCRQRNQDFCSYVTSSLDGAEFDVFGFSTICSSYPLTLRIAREVKRTHPTAVVILGGPQASVVDQATMEAFPFVDYIVRGEAEQSFPMLLDNLARDVYPAAPGVTLRANGSIVRTPPAPLLIDLDSLPTPAFHLYGGLSECRYVPLELGRGCPFGCTFCSTNDFFRRRFRLRSPQRVLAEMRQIRDTYKISTFDLIHDMFTVDRKRVASFCQTILDSGETFYWNCSARTDCIDDDLIQLMAQAGCRGIFFGIETGSQRLQKVVKKNLDLREAIKRIEFTDKHRISTAVSLITCFPDETEEDLRDTVHFLADSLRLDHAQPQLHLLAPLAETSLHSLHRQELILDDIMSDMSYQGWRQDPADRELIQAYPDIFPNFYSIPTPGLDRRFVKELREFLLNGIARFRWILVAMEQVSGDLIGVFRGFEAWRAELPARGPSPDVDSARYYGTPEFARDFLEYARTRYVATQKTGKRALSTMIEYEMILNAAADSALPAATGGEASVSQTAPLPPPARPEPFKLDAVPRLADGVKTTEIPGDFLRVIRRLRRKRSLTRIPSKGTVVVTRTNADQRVAVVQLSSLSAELLRWCDGERSVREISGKLSRGKGRMADIPPDKVCLFGLELLRQQGIVTALAEVPGSAAN